MPLKGKLRETGRRSVRADVEAGLARGRVADRARDSARQARAGAARAANAKGTAVVLSADDLVQLLTQLLYVAIFVLVAAKAARHTSRSNVDIALLFGVTSLVIAEQWIAGALPAPPPPWLNTFASVLIMALPYLLLRLLYDFADVPRAVARTAELGLLLSVLALVLLPPPLPLPAVLLMVGYFFALTIYVALAFARAARRSTGVTHRRMQAVALGTVCLGLTILAAGVQEALPALSPLWSVCGRLFGLASGVCYLAGFAPPTWLRRAWQEPELRAFLARAANLPRLPSTEAILIELRSGVARSVGAPGAAIGLWDEAAQVLRFPYLGWAPPSEAVAEAQRSGLPPGSAFRPDAFEVRAGQLWAGRAFAAQRPLYTTDAAATDPANAAIYRAFGVTTILVAPITAGEKRLGVLVVHAPHAPIFADSDLELVTLLADQAAVVLESRALIDEAARVRAREEAARLKDDFLSSAAHDLRTPLTTLLGQAQLLERRAVRDGLPPEYTSGISRLVSSARHLSALVHELLDASRAERGRLVDEREVVDLAALARDAGEPRSTERHAVLMDAPEPVLGRFDPVRLRQLVDNLIENAVKYSPDGGQVRVRVWREGEEARLTVADRGIGIPPEDLPGLFERYHRGRNVDDRRFSGLGLGLYICRAVAEQHGGRIWAESTLGQGTTIHVALPLSVPELVGDNMG